MADLERFTFGGIDLAVRVTSFSDARRQRLVVQEIPKRDGARIEDMGRAAIRLKGTLVFTGVQRVDRVRQLRALLDENPKRTLIHPIWGQMPAACFGWEQLTLDYARATGGGVIEVPGVEFVEDQLDVVQQDPENIGVSAGAQAVTAATVELQSTAASYPSAGPAVQTLINDAIAFASAAAASANGNPDASLDSLLANVGSSTLKASDALLGDPAAPTNASAYEAVAAAEVVYAAALDLSDALGAAQPPTVTFTTEGTTSLAVFCAARYGAEDALARMDTILRLNRIDNPTSIPAGTKLLIPAE